MVRNITVLPGGKVFVPTEEPKFLKELSPKKDSRAKKSQIIRKKAMAKKKKEAKI